MSSKKSWVLGDIYARQVGLFGGSSTGLSPSFMAAWHPPSRSSRTEWDVAVSSSGYGNAVQRRDSGAQIEMVVCCPWSHRQGDRKVFQGNRQGDEEGAGM